MMTAMLQLLDEVIAIVLFLDVSFCCRVCFLFRIAGIWRICRQIGKGHELGPLPRLRANAGCLHMRLESMLGVMMSYRL